MNDAKSFDPKELQVIQADPQIRAARFSPCGKILAAGGFDGRLRRWTLEEKSSKELPALESHHAWIDGLAFRGEGELLFSGDSWGQLVCWGGYSSEKPAAKWKQEKAHDGWIRELAVSPDGKVLASCGTDRMIRLWNTDDGAKKGEIAADGRDILRLRFAPDGSIFGGDDRGMVRQWQADGKLLKTFDAAPLYALSRLQDVGGVHAMALSGDGKLLAAGGVKPKNGGTVVGTPTLYLFDIASGEMKQTYELGTENDCFVADVHFHSDDALHVVTYGTPGQGQLLALRPTEKTPFFTFKKMANCQSISWHPDGKRFAVVATNSGSNGNGRPLDKDGKYVTNKSPIHVFAVG